MMMMMMNDNEEDDNAHNDDRDADDPDDDDNYDINCYEYVDYHADSVDDNHTDGKMILMTVLPRTAIELP